MLETLIRNATNHIVAYKRKGFSVAWPLDALVTAASSGPNDHQIFGFHTGYGVNEIWCLIGLLPADSSVANQDPRVRVDAISSLGGGSTLTGSTFRYPRVETGGHDTPDAIAWGWSRIESVADNTEYELRAVVDHYARVLCMAVWEVATLPVDDAVEGAVDPRFGGTGNPILDANVSEVIDNHRDVWDKHAKHLFSWSRQDAANAPQASAATYRNLMDLSITTIDATTPGVVLNLADCESVSSSSVSVKLAVRGEVVSGGGTGYVRVTDASATNLVEVSGFTGGTSWETATATFQAQDGIKVDIRVLNNAGLGGFRVDSVNLWIED